jgi:NAD(P)-dependent dehydrogenase (short-subunit alcohol dehydrogenase family)
VSVTAPAPTKSMSLTFSGGDALVTGAAAGIGAAIARTLMSAGLRTIRLDIRMPEPDRAYDAQRQVCVAADVCDDELAHTLTAAGAHPERISYLVNCAGILDNTGFHGVTPQAWLRCLDINLVGAYRLIDVLSPALRSASAAAVVNITSIEADRVIAFANPDPTPHYAASKAALNMLTRTAARALAADGIRVNSVSPGFVATAMAAVHGPTDQLPPSLATRVPAGRFAAADEIADAVAFLLSDQAGYITGADLRVDGGFHLT